MCLITGFVNFENSLEKTFNVLEKLTHRGVDGKGIYINNKNYFEKNIDKLKKKIPHERGDVVLGHSLHSIVKFNPQPLMKKGVLVANCEIYNWEQLKKKYLLESKNDAEVLLDLIELKGIENIKKVISEIEGPFAFAYYDRKNEKIILARDVIGEKPLWFGIDGNKFCFASERKAIFIEKNVISFDPRKILTYDIKNNEISFIDNKLEYNKDELNKNYSLIKKETKELLEKAILKMVPKNQKIGILFSGGIDSTFIAYVLKKKNIDFTCYTAKFEGGKIEEASDYIYAKEIAKKYDFPLKISTVKVDDLIGHTKKIIKLIEDTDYIKVSVALPFYLACERAKRDGIKVMFSGLGSEEIFAGYRRHKKVDNPNLECYKGLLTLNERDLYRDDLICMANNQELRLPFLDKKLIEYCLKIPSKYKLNLEENRSKIILREIAKDMGLDEKYSERQKKAAQYGSKSDKGLLRVAKNAGVGKQRFLNELAENCEEFVGNIRYDFE